MTEHYSETERIVCHYRPMFRYICTVQKTASIHCPVFSTLLNNISPEESFNCITTHSMESFYPASFLQGPSREITCSRMQKQSHRSQSCHFPSISEMLQISFTLRKTQLCQWETREQEIAIALRRAQSNKIFLRIWASCHRRHVFALYTGAFSKKSSTFSRKF